jgi:hypothetical protein
MASMLKLIMLQNSDCYAVYLNIATSKSYRFNSDRFILRENAELNPNQAYNLKAWLGS